MLPGGCFCLSQDHPFGDDQALSWTVTNLSLPGEGGRADGETEAQGRMSHLGSWGVSKENRPWIPELWMELGTELCPYKSICWSPNS